MEFTFPVIGFIRSCFKEKFGIPRQPGLAPLARGQLELVPPYNDPAAFEGLENCSHLWVQFVFHANSRSEWKPRVKPPRLGGNKSLGVFATRSPVRPSPLGLSVVQLLQINQEEGQCVLELGGLDLLDGTPVIDIKPYLPYADCIADAVNPLAPVPPPWLPVSFSQRATAQLAERGDVTLAALVQQILQQDPRPSYQTPDPERIYGMKLLDMDVRWRYRPVTAGWEIEVIDLVPVQVI